MTTLLASNAPPVQASGTSLTKLITHHTTDQRLRQSADTLVVLGHQLEQLILDSHDPTDLLIGTLRFSLFRVHQARVTQLASRCRSITIFGEADTPPPSIPGVEFVPLPSGSALTQEWFLLVNSASFWGALIAQVLPERNSNTRRFIFEGVLSPDERIVGRAHLLLSLAQQRSMPAIGERDLFSNRQRWARLVYQIATHAEAERLNLLSGLSLVPDLAELAAARTLPADQLYSTLLRGLRHHGQASDAALYRFQGADLQPLAWTSHQRPQALPGHSAWVSEAIALNQPIAIADRTHLQPSFPQADTIFALPILVDGQSWGMLLIGQGEQDLYEAPAAMIASGSASMLGLILANRHEQPSSSVPAISPVAPPPAPVAPAPVEPANEQSTPFANFRFDDLPPLDLPPLNAPPPMPTPAAAPTTTGGFGLPSWMRVGATPLPGGIQAPNALPTPGSAPAAIGEPRPDQSLAELQRRMVSALVAFDQRRAEQIWHEASELYTSEEVCTDLIVPVQVAIGEGWHRGEVSVAAEHFASRFVQGKLINMLNTLPESGAGPLAIVGCAQGELHEIGATMVALFMRWSGIRVIYLGQNVPNTTIEDVIRQLRPQILALSATTVEGAYQLIETGQIIARIEPPRPQFIFGGMAFYERPDLRARIRGQHLDGDVRATIRQIASQLRGR
jgi:methanogenic corrinoid protein MtbC1